MDRIGVRELRQNASKYLDMVKRGHSIEVTERGEPIAVLNPIGTTVTALERLAANGDLALAQGDVRDVLRTRPPAPALPADGPSASDILDEQRAERL